MPLPVPPTETRSLDDLAAHYRIERGLAERLRGASKEERRELYGAVYDELVRRVPQLLEQDADPEAQRRLVELQAIILEPYLHAGTRFLEVGSGRSGLARALARQVREVFIVEPCSQILAGIDLPANVRRVSCSGAVTDLRDESVDLAFSCHFIEHLHPDDAGEHAAEMVRVLVPGGRYVCVTPNRLWGPHDISRHFDDAPTGLHLREYVHGELARLFRRAGFREVMAVRGLGGRSRPRRLLPYRLVEGVLDLLPVSIRRGLMDLLLPSRPAPFRPLEQVKIVARA